MVCSETGRTGTPRPSDQRATPVVGGRRRSKPISIGAPGKPSAKKKFHPKSPNKYVGADGLIQLNL